MDQKHTNYSALRNRCRKVITNFRVNSRRLPSTRLTFQLCHMSHERETQDFIPDNIHFESPPPHDTRTTQNVPEEPTVHDRTPSTVIEGDLDIVIPASVSQRHPSPAVEPPSVEESTWLGPVNGTQETAQSGAAVQMRAGLEHLVGFLMSIEVLLLMYSKGARRYGQFLCYADTTSGIHQK